MKKRLFILLIFISSLTLFSQEKKEKINSNREITFKCNMCGNKGIISITNNKGFKKTLKIDNKKDAYIIRQTHMLKSGMYTYSFSDNKKNTEKGMFNIRKNQRTVITFFED